MRKICKNLMTILVVFTMAFAMLPLTASADAATTISFSKSNVSVGDNVTVTVRVSEKALSGTQVHISYNEEILTYISGADGGAGSLMIVDDKLTGSENSASYTISFKAKKAGACLISVSGTAAAGMPPQDIPLTGASANMTVKDVTLSSNANLKSMSVSSGRLSPAFSPSKTKYTVNVKKSVTDCKIYATTADSDATVSVSGSSKLQIGENTRVVTVTAPSGNKKEYTVVIKRSNVDEIVESSDVSTTVNENLETVIDGVSYAVMQDIKSVSLPEGFNVTKRLYNGEDVSVATDKNGNFQLFYLLASGSDKPVPYTYNEQENTFQKIVIFPQGANKYILTNTPENVVVPAGYYSTNVVIDGDTVECIASADEAFKDMYYIYCFFGGEYGTYRYDAVENVLQRSPEMNISVSEIQSALNTEGDGSLFDRFALLSSTAKTILVCAFILVVGIIALVVLLIVKLVARNKAIDFDNDDFDDDFDSVEFANNYDLISDSEDQEK